MNLEWSPRALRQLSRAIATIADEDPSAAWRIYDRIHEYTALLVRLPEVGKEGR
jgi:plasmid stabilization system protein ParE